MARQLSKESPPEKRPNAPEENARQATALLAFLKKYGLLGALLVAYFVMALSSVADKSTTYDEMAHLTAGYSYWLDNDYRLAPEAGNLGQRWFALPLLLGDYQLPSKHQPSWWTSDYWVFGREFFYGLGNDLEAMLFAGRTMAALLGVALCLVVYRCSSSLFGRVGGLISLALCAFSPTVLAHGRLITLDVPAALFFLLFVWRFWILLHRITPWTLLWSCLAIAGLLLTKMSGVLAIPIALILLTIRLLSKEPLTIAIGQPRKVQSRLRLLRAFGAAAVLHVFVCFFAIWALNGFRYSAMKQSVAGRDRLLEPWWQLVNDSGAVASTLNFARDNRLLPEAYLHGFAYVLKYSQVRTAFLDGDTSDYGWRSFFIYCLFYKTPLSLFLILAISFLAVVSVRPSPPVAAQRRAAHSILPSLYHTAPIWVLFVIYWAVAINAKINLGQRHILPTYPPMFILAGAAAFWFKQRHPVALALKALAVLAVLVLIVQSLLIWPHYLAFFNSLAGGPKNGYRHLVDSSLDWGQDLPGLKKWLDRHKDESPVYLSYFGTGDPRYYGISAKLLPARPDEHKRQSAIRLTAGTYCISATRLQLTKPVVGPWSTSHENKYQQLLSLARQYAQATNGRTGPPQPVLGRSAAYWRRVFSAFDHFRFARLAAFLRQREPDDSVGYSILIYRLTDQDINQALFGPPVELSTN
ncbi:MAG: glycosyltransferase family 39 protein [Phycisphaerae bacterium]|nr:glycosyltransferase family 39 protein [Phycisphaerae bacterium]